MTKEQFIQGLKENRKETLNNFAIFQIEKMEEEDTIFQIAKTWLIEGVPFPLDRQSNLWLINEAETTGYIE